MAGRESMENSATTPQQELGPDPSGLTLPLKAGDRVGNFRVNRLIARGGMGGVFEAVHPQIARRAAVKVPYSEYARHPQMVARFLNEARAVNLARHPGLVQIFDLGFLADGSPYLMMEYLEGDSLGDRLDHAGGRPLLDALPLARQIAFALAAAHHKGIVHRDLKPDNIIIQRDPDPPFHEHAQVLDFGIAKMTDVSVSAGTHTIAGAVMGTPRYMSPEQCVGLVSVDGRADVYALGVILYEMLSGRLPFQGEIASDFIIMHLRHDPPPLRSINPAVPEELEALVHQMLAKRPQERPSMTRVGEELARLEGLGATHSHVDTEPQLRVPAGPQRILLIDDDLNLGPALQLLLQGQGYECRYLDRADSATEVIAEFRPHAVLSDIELPGKSGYKLCWELKSAPETHDIPVVLISAKARESDEKLGLAMQADAYIRKPFEFEQLLTVLQLLLARSGQAEFANERDALSHRVTVAR